MKSKFPPVQLQVPLHTWRPVLSAQPLPGTLLLQGIKLEGLVVPQQQTFLLQPAQPPDILCRLLSKGAIVLCAG